MSEKADHLIALREASKDQPVVTELTSTTQEIYVSLGCATRALMLVKRSPYRQPELESNLRAAIEALRMARAWAESRVCTCHPDDNPPEPCPQRYALDECRKSARDDVLRRAWANLCNAERDHPDGLHNVDLSTGRVTTRPQEQ